MSILSLTFRDLQYLVALADHRNFGRAAKSCSVSQPALSAQIKKIEGYFGKQFFERRNRQVFLTDEGSFVVEKARELLNQAQVLDGMFQSRHKNFSTPLTIGLIHTLSPYYPSFFIKELLSQYPHSSLVFKEGYTDDLVFDLKTGKIDALIASEVFHDEKLESHRILKEPLCLVINKNHSFATKDKISLSDLNADEMIFLKEGNCLRNESIDLCPKNKRGNIKEYHLSSLEALKHTVAFNKSYAIIPRMAAELEDKLKNFVVIKPIDDAEAYRQISLFTRKQNFRTEDLSLFLDILRAT